MHVLSNTGPGYTTFPDVVSTPPDSGGMGSEAAVVAGTEAVDLPFDFDDVERSSRCEESGGWDAAVGSSKTEWEEDRAEDGALEAGALWVTEGRVGDVTDVATAGVGRAGEEAGGTRVPTGVDGVVGLCPSYKQVRRGKSTGRW